MHEFNLSAEAVDFSMAWLIQFDTDSFCEWLDTVGIGFDPKPFIDWVWENDVRSVDGMTDFHSAFLLWLISNSNWEPGIIKRMRAAIKPWGPYTWIDCDPSQLQADLQCLDISHKTNRILHRVLTGQFFKLKTDK
jgi:hypothetical protein